MISPKIILLLLAFTGFSCNSAHTSKEKDKNRPEEVVPKVVTADIESGIRAYIDDKVREGEGYFQMTTDGQDLRLELVRVHTEYLSNLGPGRHFACVDLADRKGDVYDVDFFLEGDPGKMMVTEKSLHKLNGKPFYTWKQRKDKTWQRVAIEAATSDLMGVIEGRDQFEFHYRVTLPDITDSAEMWIPIPTSDRFQQVELLSIESPVSHRILQDTEYGNSVLYLIIPPQISKNQIELVFDVTRQEKNPYAENSSPEDFLDPNFLLPVNDRFRKLADSIVAARGSGNTLMQARALYDYIIDNMQYRKVGRYGTGDAVYACDALSGNCSEFHSLFISLARSIGIPARFAIGASIPSERNEGGISGYHCWAEFFAEGKWWPIDISEANKYTALASYYFGRHPANRIELSRGRDLALEPGPESGPINFLAYPVLEIGKVPASAVTTFSFIRKSS